jgi:hypothetical protein
MSYDSDNDLIPDRQDGMTNPDFRKLLRERLMVAIGRIETDSDITGGGSVGNVADAYACADAALAVIEPLIELGEQDAERKRRLGQGTSALRRAAGLPAPGGEGDQRQASMAPPVTSVRPSPPLRWRCETCDRTGDTDDARHYEGASLCPGPVALITELP